MKKNFKKYSVLMSVYYKENPKYLEESIESILNQTIVCDEFVLVEDGKLTKELDKIIKKYEDKYPKIFRIIKFEKNRGLGLALRDGVLECKNELIARIDSDDISVPNRCELQLERFNLDEDLDLIGANHIEFIDSIKNPVSYKKLPETFDEVKNYIRKRNPFSHSVVMFKKNSVLKAGNYRDYHYLEDYDMWARMILNGSKCENINKYLSYVRVSKDLYERRGGIKYLKSLLKFKKELYKNGISSLSDYISGSIIHSIVCLVPGKLRKLIYIKILRK